MHAAIKTGDAEAVLDAYDDGLSLLLSIDGGGVILALSGKARAVLPFREGDNLLDGLDSLSREQVRHALRALRKNPSKSQGPLTLHTKKNEQGFRAGVWQLPDCEGTYLLSAVDLTPFAEREKNLHSILENSLQGIVVHGGHGRPLFVNQTLARMLGYDTVGDIMKAGAFEGHLDPDTLNRIYRFAEDRMAGRSAPEEYQIPVRNRAGETVWLHIRSKVIDWEGVPAVLATVQDISRQKQEEGRRLLSETLFRKIFDTSPDLVPITRLKDGTVFDANPAFLDAFGFSREEVLNRRTEEIGIFRDPEDRKRLVKAVLEHDTVRDFELVCRRKDGSEFPVSLSGTKLRYDNEDFMLVVGRDITERLRQERALRESIEAAEDANRAKSEFLANVSHELRTPLNAIMGFSETIRAEMFGPLGSDRYRDYAEDIHKSGKHLLEIINEILDLSKLEAGQVELDEKEVSVRDILRDALTYIEEEAGKKDIRLTRTLPGKDLVLICDRRRIVQILLNLLSNAVKFTPEGGKIVVAVECREKGGLNIRVQDTGPGMSAEEIEQVLQPFGQVASSQTRGHEGTGLGLPIAVAFAELHGGKLVLESTLGEGTCAILSLPAEKTAS